MVRRQKPGRIGAVVAALGAEIAGGSHAEGATLPAEHELEARFGVSRSVVREAMRTLAAKGLVSVAPRHGTRVRPRAEWSLLDRDVLTWLTGERGPERELLLALEETRAIIEPAAAALAAQRATAEDQLRLTEALVAMQRGRTDAAAAVAADRAFHLAVLDATHNPVLQSFRGAIDAILSAIFAASIDEMRWFEENLPNHASVVEAILRRDAAAARRAMEATIGFTRRNLEARG
ncbi:MULTISPECIES: FadR/GntR family transcriptional regulator [Chelatococcus]|uniref:GntR family galactonate operon transcriptional repressor n=1 Tax=Chelatococcus caeni TaxID=1348468 RepID=A0A840BY86_9HYPH|nr:MULTISPECIES: FCD domain-containing protein [Chelatococcus]ALA16883.1 GntR family transcriptional regulator [Chelatococcus sp. CO-6]MBB4017523.1 GntR family galactonate operon transcriptional repressor [Chelatococcus caeni]